MVDVPKLDDLALAVKPATLQQVAKQVSPVVTPGTSASDSGAPVEWPPAGPDPAYVHGYIALVDPATGAEHLVHNDPDDPSLTLGYPAPIYVHFRQPDGINQYAIDLEAGMGVREVVREADGTLQILGHNNAGSIAWYYRFQLNADLTEGIPRYGAPPSVVRTDYTTAIFSYNPTQWRFYYVSMVSVYMAESGSIALTQRATPFPDLSDPAN